MKSQDHHRVMFFVHLTSTIILGVTYGTILVLHVFGAGIDAGILAPMYALISAMALFLNHNSVPFSTDDRTWGQLNFATRGVGVAAGGMAGQQWLHQAVGGPDNPVQPDIHSLGCNRVSHLSRVHFCGLPLAPEMPSYNSQPLHLR